jgi:hypothetical protein
VTQSAGGAIVGGVSEPFAGQRGEPGRDGEVQERGAAGDGVGKMRLEAVKKSSQLLKKVRKSVDSVCGHSRKQS